jgi:aminoglycoside phosphotransferase family enzyme
VGPARRRASTLVSFLRQPQVYPDAPRAVSVIETHMSWVFLTDTHVYKLKKAIRHDEIDFSTPERRRHNCEEEVRLNTRLAPGVYLGVVPLTRGIDERLAVGGPGEPVDWLVHMRRLPDGRNLEAVIASGRVHADEARIRTAARALARFFAAAAPEPMTGATYRARLEAGTRADQGHLSEARYGLSRARVDALVHAQLEVLNRCSHVFDRRAAEGRVIEGHGDLRPEHIWLDPGPAVIDCVEFDRDLRLMDPADELAFLALECERLGAPEIGAWFVDGYTETTGDAPPAMLLEFYRTYRSLRRATIAARHLDDPTVPDPDRFLDRARQYLDRARPVSCATS